MVLGYSPYSTFHNAKGQQVIDPLTRCELPQAKNDRWSRDIERVFLLSIDGLLAPLAWRITTDEICRITERSPSSKGAPRASLEYDPG